MRDATRGGKCTNGLVEQQKDRKSGDLSPLLFWISLVPTYFETRVGQVVTL